MNLKHPYEKHLAEKLVQLPPAGDPDQNWPQMKTLLDDEMPRGGGGMLGAQRWIIPVIIFLAIGTGVWFGGKQFLPAGRSTDSMAGTINKTTNSASTGSGTVKEKAVVAAPTPVAPTPATTTPAASENSGNDLVAGTTDVYEKEKTFNRSREKIEPKPEPVPVVAKVVNTSPPKATATATTNTTNNSNNKINADRKKVYAPTKNNKRKRNTPSNDVASLKSVEIVAGPTDVIRETPAEPVVTAAEKEEEETNSFVSLPTVRLHKPATREVTKSVKESPVDIIVDYTSTAPILTGGVIQKDYTYLSPGDLFPDLVVQKQHSRRKSGRSYEARNDRALAIGLSLPLGFPLGDQEPLAFNRQAGANTISDYIPSPHIQYHINSRTYFQTQVQLSSPQFIRPILLSRSEQATPVANTFIYHSVYARKLYYFNVPVSVYHSPMRNFYMGTGLQFSSMLSGVALTEKRRVSPGDEYIISQQYARFANDTLSHRLNSNEVRLLLDMNYYWHRFIVGLQYNQAFNNYVSLQVNPTSPYIVDKNKSLQFYLRYNIWEDRKKKRKSETMLSLK